jgi:hypothetical protein
MGQFGRPGLPVAVSYHSYIAEEKTLQNIGLASYTRNSLARFGKEKKNGVENTNKDALEYFGGSIPTGQLLGDSATLSILKFDKDNKRYVLRTSDGAGEDSLWYTPSGNIASLKKFQEDFDLWQKGFITDDPTKYKLSHVWTNIQTSFSGCITFTANYTALTCSQSGLVKIYFQSAGRATADRGVAQQTSNVWAGPPVRATQGKWAYAPTQSTGPGQYSPVLPGGNNIPQNTVAGKMRMSYDTATGQWESGTQQMLFRLLTDLDGVPIADLPDDFDERDINDFYSGGLASTFTTGSGMAMSVENGNPYLFGPNTVGCVSSPKEKVLMVNRTPRNYVKGEIVLASLINGEWIPMGFGIPTTASKKLEVEWSQIQKYIVNANSFFRDMANSRYITHQDYENYLRTKFYSGLSSATTTNASDNAKINIFGLDNGIMDQNGNINLTNYDINKYENIDMKNLVPSTGYLTSFDADLIRKTLGGNSERDYLFRTNISKTPADELDSSLPYYANTPFNWGLFFREGYTRSSVAKFKANDGKSLTGAGTGASIYTNGTLSLKGEDLPKPMFDISDSNLYHMPAQIALNSAANPTVDFINMWKVHSQAGSNFVASLSNYVSSYKVGGSYLKTEEGINAYALKPASSTSVQFSPLPLELALSDLQLPKDGINYFQNGYASLKAELETIFGSVFGIADYTNSKLLSTFWTRNGLSRRVDLGSNVYSRIGLSSDKLRNVTNGNIEKPPFNEPKGGPNLIPPANGALEKSNIAGIVAAKATFNLVNGGTLSFDTNSYFGLKAYTLTSMANSEFSVAPFVSFILDLSGKNRESSVKQWGANEEGDPKSLGTTALFCKVYDHCPNTVFDARYFVPIQLNPNDATVDFEEPSLRAGSIISKNTNIIMQKNTSRRGMLLTGGGFKYIKKTIGINPSSFTVIEAGEDYSAGNTFTFGGGKTPAILKLKKDGPLSSDINDYEVISYGEYTNSTFDDALFGTPNKGDAQSFGTGGSVKITEGKVYQSIKEDTLEDYGMHILTPSSNKGVGDDGGYVHSAKNTTITLNKNSTGKYDIFFFFVNDILHTLTGPDYVSNLSLSNYVNLDISAN